MLAHAQCALCATSNAEPVWPRTLPELSVTALLPKPRASAPRLLVAGFHEPALCRWTVGTNCPAQLAVAPRRNAICRARQRVHALRSVGTSSAVHNRAALPAARAALDADSRQAAA